eukprot:gene37505-31805_t
MQRMFAAGPAAGASAPFRPPPAAAAASAPTIIMMATPPVAQYG